jgi:hypothetical protein
VAAEAGLPDITSPYALEGTAAHDLAERAIVRGLDPGIWEGTEIQGVEVTEEMISAVRVFVDHVWSLVQYDDDELLVEHEFDLAELNPPGPMHGTGDVVIWSPRRRTLYVCDYKHGKGLAVDATENSQLGYYALGAVISLKKRPDHIVTTIVQPRAYHPDGIVRSHTWTFGDLVTFKRELWAAAEATIAPDAKLVVGEWCRFCKAQATCPAQRSHAVELARSEFDVEQVPQLPAPDTLTLEQLDLILRRADILRGWLSAVEAHIMSALDRGEHVQGWKLVPKRAMRKWAEGVDAGTIADALDLPEEEVYTRKLASPAQIEKTVKMLYPAGTRPEIPEGLIVKESSGFNLAPDTDPRPALPPSAQTDFDIPTEPAQPKKTRRSK